MKKPLILLTAISIAVIISSCQSTEEPPIDLFNGQDLENWEMYIGTSLGSDFDSLANAATTDKVFSVVEMEGSNVIRISGEVNGSLATTESYGNYHLRLEFKWGETIYSRQNSGLLYHGYGEFGEALGTWMPNIEFQMMHDNLGDTYLMANTACETEAAINTESNQYHFTPGAEMVTFGAHAAGQSIKKSSDNELPLGEWNTLDLYCFNQIAVHVVNGETVMVNNNTGVFEDGNVNPLSSGKIQIQSEGAELFIRSIELRHITLLPDEVLP